MDFDTRLAAYAVITDRDDRILLALWNEADPPRWTLPGGGVELHETVEEATVREVREETGYDVRLGRLLGVDAVVVPAHRRMPPAGRALKSVRVLFEAVVAGGSLTREVDGTTDEARWLALDDVPGLPHVGLVEVALRHLGRPGFS